MTAAFATEIAVDPMRWSGEDIANATAARIAGPGGDLRNSLFSEVSIDSRRVPESSLFFALRGPNHDAHDFVAQALEAGAAGAVVEHLPPGADPNRCFVVPDALRALGDLAHWSREQSSGLRVVAITGSNGKTTTKEMFAAICAEAMRDVPGAVLKTAGNQNNLVGLPLTLLRMNGDESVAILEMGMNQPGEIARLTQIARPDFGVVTNVAAAHLEGVGSLDGVAAAKGELFGGMGDSTTIAVNVDDPRVCGIAERFAGRRIEFGGTADIHASEIVDHGVDGIEVTLHAGAAQQRLRLHFAGAHNVQNALAATALAHGMGFSLETVAAGLAAADPPAMRMQVVRLANGVTLINDSYNANPDSVIAGLRALATSGGRRWAILGEMRELGGHSTRLHREVGAEAARLGLDFLLAVGARADEIARGAGDSDQMSVRVCDDAAAAVDIVSREWESGDVLLVKGSRGPDDDPAVRRYGSRMAEIVALLEGRARG